MSRSYVAAEQRLDPLRLAPLERAAGTPSGRRRHERLHHRKHLADPALGRPVDHRQRPPGFATRAQLRRRRLLVGREHGAARRRDDVEARVREVERLGVADSEVDGEPRLGRIALRRLDQARGEVDRDDVSAACGRHRGELAGAARDVEPALARRRGPTASTITSWTSASPSATFSNGAFPQTNCCRSFSCSNAIASFPTTPGV